MTEDRRQMKEDERQMTNDKRWMTDVTLSAVEGSLLKDGYWKREVGRHMTEDGCHPEQFILSVAEIQSKSI